MTVDDAFDRIEKVPASEIMPGDVVKVLFGYDSVPKEVVEANKQGLMIQFKFADGKEKFEFHSNNVELCMD